jgi:hypothetical protein
MNIIDYIFLFIASCISILYEMLRKAQDKLNRKTLLMKLLGAILVAFFLIPAIMEYFKLSLKIGLFLTVILAYGLDELLTATVNRGKKAIEND